MFKRFVSSVSQLLFCIDCTIFIFDSIDTFLSKNDNAAVSDVKYHKCPENFFIVMFDMSGSIFLYNIRFLKSSKSKLGAKAATGDENQYFT